MTDDFREIPEPPPATSALTPDQALVGPRILPHLQILLYSAAQWEEFVHEWAHYGLKAKYLQVQKFSGPGDKGLDIVGFEDEQRLRGIWDNFQCKHYQKPLTLSDVLLELGKILWYSFSDEYNQPRRCFFVSPHGVGTNLARLLSDSDQLKNKTIAKWDAQVRDKINSTSPVPLEGDFREYVDKFDFAVFGHKTGLEVVEEHRTCPHHAARFGGGLPTRPAPGPVPQAIAVEESRYIARLLEAYADHKNQPIPSVETLKSWDSLNQHFSRQREAFYHAESLRVFARDTVPAGTFELLQEDIYDGVVDVHDADHSDGYVRVCAVTKAAREMQITSNALIARTNPKDRDGICHQLANEDRLRWTKQ